MIDAEKYSRNQRRCWVSYDELLSDTKSVLNRLEIQLGLQCESNPEQEAAQFLRPDLRHEDWTNHVRVTSPLALLADDLYRSIKLALGEVERLPLIFEQFAAQLTDLEPLVEPFFSLYQDQVSSRTRSSELKAKCDELSANVARLEREREADQERSVDEIRRLCDLLSTTGEQLSNSHARIARIGQEFDILQAERLEDARTHRQQIAGLEAEISTATVDLAKTNHLQSEAEDRIAEADHRIEQLEKFKAEMERQLQSTRSSLEEALDRLKNSRRVVQYYHNLPAIGPLLRWLRQRKSR
jgi:DNA repair exonuclease SbcCD ATPase subunit